MFYMDIEQAKKLAGGVLAAVGVNMSQQNYEDYKQELLLLIYKEYQKDNDVSLVNNPMLFKFLKWRLLDLLRKDSRDHKRVEPTDELPMIPCSDWDNVDLQAMFEAYMAKMNKQDVTYKLLEAYLRNPRLSYV